MAKVDGKGKGKRRSTSGKRGYTNKKPTRDSGRRTADIGEQEVKGNDLSWYTKNPQLVKDVASVPFNIMTGAPYHIDYESGGDYNISHNVSSSIPGIMTLYVTAGPGKSVNMYSPVNTAARKVFSFTRKANSGRANYESSDLMMYLIAMDQAYTLYHYACRVYGVARLYTATNRYYPEALLAAMGMDPDSVRTNMANLRATINMFAANIGALYVPKMMDYFNRHAWLFSNLYLDQDSTKAQTMLAVPHGFFEFSGDTYETGSALIWRPWIERPGMTHTAVELMNLMNSFLTKLWRNEDINIMSGDLMKAYGEENAMRMPMISDDYTVVPVIDPHFTLQFMNIYAAGAFVSEDSHSEVFKPDVIQEDNSIIFSPMTEVPVNAMSSRLINMPLVAPTAEDVMYATRWTCTHEWHEDHDYQLGTVYAFPNFGADMVNFFGVMTFAQDSSGFRPAFISVEGSSKLTNWFAFTPSTAAGTMNYIGQVTKFDYHPIIYPMFGDSEEGNETRIATEPIGDFFNVTEVQQNTINEMHRVALMSLFDV